MMTECLGRVTIITTQVLFDVIQIDQILDAVDAGRRRLLARVVDLIESSHSRRRRRHHRCFVITCHCHRRR